MDPLSVLREYTIRNALSRVVIQGDECLFGDEYRFPKSVETAYRSRIGQLYTLESLVLFVKNVGAKHTEYMQQARAAKLQIVTFTDRKPLQEYLEGKLATTDAIELLAPIPTAVPSIGPGSALPGPPAGKRREDAEAEDLGGPLSKKARAGAETGGDHLEGLMVLADEDAVARDLEAPRVSDLEMLMARERPVRDREEVLLWLTRKDAFAGVLAMLNRREEEKKRMDKQRRDAPKHEEGGKGGKPAGEEVPRGLGGGPGGSRMGGTEDKSYWLEYNGNNAIAELGIDPYQLTVQDISQQKEAAPAKVESRALVPVPRSLPQQHRPSATRSSKPEGPPIILVPNAATTLINIFNIKDFLEEGAFVLPEVKAKTAPKKPEFIAMERKMGRERAVTYHVRDKPSALGRKEWERVVAVFVLGKEWQFKDWPFKDHVEILDKFFGVFVRFEDSSVESAAAVRQWNVKFLSLSKHKRHQDRTAALEFWDKLDVFLRARKSTLVF